MIGSRNARGASDGKITEQKILDHLRKKGSISFLEAWTLYTVRSLPRRIKDLREQGYDIISDRRKDLNGQRYVRYNMA